MPHVCIRAAGLGPVRGGSRPNALSFKLNAPCRPARYSLLASEHQQLFLRRWVEASCTAGGHAQHTFTTNVTVRPRISALCTRTQAHYPTPQPHTHASTHTHTHTRRPSPTTGRCAPAPFGSPGSCCPTPWHGACSWRPCPPLPPLPPTPPRPPRPPVTRCRAGSCNDRRQHDMHTRQVGGRVGAVSHACIHSCSD
jgi:hypothetical protein